MKRNFTPPRNSAIASGRTCVPETGKPNSVTGFGHVMHAPVEHELILVRNQNPLAGEARQPCER